MFVCVCVCDCAIVLYGLRAVIEVCFKAVVSIDTTPGFLTLFHVGVRISSGS